MRSAGKLLAFFSVAILLLAGISSVDVAEGGRTRSEQTLRVAVRSDTATGNVLASTDMWTRNALFPVYGTVGLFLPETDEPVPYILKGIDANDNGVFESDEYGVFGKETGANPLVVTVFYDFSGVYFHDGVQVTMEDLLFSYHLEALRPSVDSFAASIDVLKDRSNLEESNYSSTRWLWVYPVEDIWDERISVGGNSTLTFALRFEMQSSYFAFIDHTLMNARVFPRHIWEGAGGYCDRAEEGICLEWETDIHEDFGYAYDPVTKNAVPADDASAFDLSNARSWLPEDRHIVGTGPFMFDEWNKGSSVSLIRFEEYYVNARDKDGNSYLHRPYIDGIVYKIFRTAQSAVFALWAGEVDVVGFSIPPYYSDPWYRSVSIVNTPERAFYYLGYNMRESPFGYPDGDPTNGDVGIHLRKAIAHTIDKKKIVTTILQNFGVVGDQPVSPADVRWYNESVQKYDYDLNAAGELLDYYYTGEGMYNPDNPDPLGYGPSGYRNLPSIGDRRIDVLTYYSDFEYRCTGSAKMIAADLRAVGINAEFVRKSSTEIQERLVARNVEMWIHEAELLPDPPGYFYDFFYSGNSRSGMNYAGFQNDAFDQLVLDARAEISQANQANLIKTASGILADALPYDVLFFRTNIEAYRDDRFSNWTAGRSGSIIRESFWSLVGIHPPLERDLIVSLYAPSAMASLATKLVKAVVMDVSGNVVSGATVEICVNSFSTPWSSGNLTLGEKKGTCISGVTDVNGAVLVEYQAPDIKGLESLAVKVDAEATAVHRFSCETSAFITIYPKEEQFLSVEVRMKTGDVLPVGYSILVDVEVTDQDMAPLSGAMVNLTSVPEGLSFEPANGTTVDGSIKRITVTHSSGIQMDVDFIRFNIVVRAELEGYGNSTGIAEVIVLELGPAPPGSSSSDTYLEWRLGLIGTMLVAVILLALVRLVTRPARERNKKKHGK